jgi:short-subunit dehydrogenase
MTVSRTLILGGSRGLGKALMDLIPDALAISRTSVEPLDLSGDAAADSVLTKINDFKPDRIFYVAGGGPHGAFFEKSMKSHKWAYNVNQFTPIQILYGLIEQGYKGEFIYIGSAIAERSTSSKSLSYAASKRSATVTILSYESKSLITKVFSPAYMNTDLLPKGAWPRTDCPELVAEPRDVAKILLNWLDVQNGDSDSRHFDWIDRFDYTLPKDKDL